MRSKHVGVYACLMVALYAAEPAQIALTVTDHIRLDRLSAAGAVDHTDLIKPGTTTVQLAAGQYVFRTTGDAQVVLRAGSPVQVTQVTPRNKDEFPDPSPSVSLPLAAKGDHAPDRVPTLTVR